MVPGSTPKASLEGGQENYVRRIVKKHAFCDHLVPFRRHFGHSWVSRGSQNLAFWHKVALKSQKMTS